MGRRQKIAIVGSGGGGLACAYLLAQVADVTVYEAEGWLGGHVRTVDFPCADGITRPVDMGIVITDPWTYPVLYALLEKFRIDTRATGWTLGAAFGADDFWYTGGPTTALFRRVRDECSRFDIDAMRLYEAPFEAQPATVSGWLGSLGYSDEFAAKVLSPTLTLLVVSRAGLLTAPPGRIARLFADRRLSFFNATLWRLFPGGARQYVDALVASTPATFRPSTPVKSVARTDDGVMVTDASGDIERFDQVVFGTQANITLALLADPTAREREILGTFTFEPGEFYLHSDDSVLSEYLPKDLCSQYHYYGPDAQAELQGGFTLNTGAGLGFPAAAGPVLLTGYAAGSRAARPDPKKMVAYARWEHALSTLAQLKARAALHKIQGSQGTWHCGTSTVIATADAVLTSGMVLAKHISPDVVFPFDEPLCVDDYRRMEELMFPRVG